MVFNLKLLSEQGEMETGTPPVWVWDGGVAQQGICLLAELGEHRRVLGAVQTELQSLPALPSARGLSISRDDTPSVECVRKRGGCGTQHAPSGLRWWLSFSSNFSN